MVSQQSPKLLFQVRILVPLPQSARSARDCGKPPVQLTDLVMGFILALLYHSLCMTEQKDRLPSFRDLDGSPSVDPDTLVRVFEDYVRTGAAIDSMTIINLIYRTPLTLAQLGAIGEGINVGLEDQTRRGFPKDANEYVDLGLFVSERMNVLSLRNKGNNS